MFEHNKINNSCQRQIQKKCLIISQTVPIALSILQSRFHLIPSASFSWNPIEPVRSNRIQGLIVGGERICIRYHCAVRTSGMSTHSIEIANSTELHNILLMLDTIAAPLLLSNR
jgi:hypothetical protein